MTTITEYRDGYINQIGAPGSSFRIDGNVTGSVSKHLLTGNLKNIIFSSNQSITFTNQTDLLTNTCRMYWNCLGNTIEYDLIDQVFDKDIVVSKQLLYTPETASSVASTTNFLGEIITDHDGNNGGPFDARFGNAAVRLISANYNLQLYNPATSYNGIYGKPDWWAFNEITPYFDGLEITFIKTDTASGDIFINSSALPMFYHNNPTRALNPAGDVSLSTFKFRARQHIKAKLIKVGVNPDTYGWHIMEGKTPAP